jgi:hypothetical protein
MYAARQGIILAVSVFLVTTTVAALSASSTFTTVLTCAATVNFVCDKTQRQATEAASKVFSECKASITSHIQSY